jgi:tripartite-type tricarboxylate transporter receptor subunit TctC
MASRWIVAVALALVQTIAVSIAGVSTVGVFAAVAAEDFPTRPVTVIVPFPAGGGPDVVARILAGELSEKLGQSFVVDNRSGASGDIGAEFVVRSAPDGYTLVFGTPYPLMLNKMMMAKLPFDPTTDLVPIALVGKSAHILVTSPNSSVGKLDDMIAQSKTHPNTLSAGIPGIGTTSHLVIEALMNRVGGKMLTVPYRGTPPLADIENGLISVSVSLVSSYVSQVQDGSLHAVAVSTSHRDEELPDVPTVEELGYPDFDFSAWLILAAPRGTPAPVIEKINAAINQISSSPRWQARLRSLGVEGATGSAEDAKAFIASERQKWAPVVKAADIKM